ncbi:MAG TPA: hypothetical protein VHL11_15935, partial [Phototrophicaceae bacterium]|nr:hypothetical protein [Phototrophicaceae bacterium]
RTRLNLQSFPIRKYIFGLLAILLPIAAYLLWRRIFGTNFTIVEERWFGRQPFDFKTTREGWEIAFEQILNPDNLQRRVYYLLELFGIILAVVASLFTLRRYPGVALFGLVALVPGLTSGYPQSLIRYVVSIPAIFIFLSRLGKNEAFDRAWSLASILSMGMLLTLFTWDMWVA